MCLGYCIWELSDWAGFRVLNFGIWEARGISDGFLVECRYGSGICTVFFISIQRMICGMKFVFCQCYYLCCGTLSRGDECKYLMIYYSYLHSKISKDPSLALLPNLIHGVRSLQKDCVENYPFRSIS